MAIEDAVKVSRDGDHVLLEVWEECRGIINSPHHQFHLATDDADAVADAIKAVCRHIQEGRIGDGS